VIPQCEGGRVLFDRDAGLLKLLGSVREDTQLATPDIRIIGEHTEVDGEWHTHLQYREQTKVPEESFERETIFVECTEISENDTLTDVPNIFELQQTPNQKKLKLICKAAR
jgi:hypothetical protein